MSLLKNSSIVIVGVFVANLLAYLFHFIAGRILGPEDYGVFGALMALFLLAALPAGALSFAVAKYTSRFNADQDPGRIALLRKRIQNDVLIFSGVLLLLIIVSSKFIAAFLKIASIYPILIVGVCLVFAILYPVNMGVLQGMKKFRAFSLNSIFEALSRIILLALFLFLGWGVNGAVLAYGLAYLITFLLVFPYIKEIHNAGPAKERIEFGSIYRFTLQVLLLNILFQSFLNIPSLFIKHFYSDQFTGYWTAALNIARMSSFVSMAIAQVMFPEIAEKTQEGERKKIFVRAVILVLVSTSAMALLFYAIPEIFIQILYGSTYIEAAPILQWLGLAMILIGMFIVWANYYLAKLK